MKAKFLSSHHFQQKALLVAIILALILSIFVAYQYWSLKAAFSAVNEENYLLNDQLDSERTKNSQLTQTNFEQSEIIESFSGQIQDIQGTVGTLEKLSQTDEELLKKYSKISFLNENYVPSKLTDIDKQYFYNGSLNFQIHADVWPFLEDLLEAAQDDGVDLLVASAYRSFGTQASLKSGYTVLYGSGANQFSADQGYSEHQLGTTLDFTTSKVGGNFTTFEADPAYKWLINNAYKYGFVLSYPKGNTYYKFEPWHWRFVGTSLAKFLHNENKNFYDLEQRQIDPYLINIFD